jgi:hypothetical protein
LPFTLDAGHEQLLELRSATGVLRQEADRDAVPPRLRELDAAHRAQQAVGHLGADASTVSTRGVCTLAAAVLHVAKRVQGAPNGVVRRRPAQASDERDAAAVMLVRCIVQAVSVVLGKIRVADWFVWHAHGSDWQLLVSGE